MTQQYTYAVRTLCSIVMLLCSVAAVYADEQPTVRITEIMYNAEGLDEGKEFVEVINAGQEPIDMTTVGFFERSDRQSGRKISQHRGSAILPSGGIAVIVADPEKFLSNYVFDGTILDTSIFALLNAGATVSLKQSDRLLHSISYTKNSGAQGDGHSLHIKQDDTITAGSPTPGTVNTIPAHTPQSNSDTDTREDTEEVPNKPAQKEAVTDEGEPEETENMEPETVNSNTQSNEVIKDEITIMSDPPTVFSASTTMFSAVRVSRNGENKETISGLWNFGDGTFLHGEVTEHAYLHPGTYIIVFQELGENGEAGITLQREIKVLFPQISIERIDSAFVRLHNHHPFTLDVSGWRVESSTSVFEFPDNSLVPEQGSTVVSFPAGKEDHLFFITAGGGQFSGKQPEPKNESENTQQDNQGGNAADKKEDIIENIAVESPAEFEKEPVHTAEKLNKENLAPYEEKPKAVDIRMVIVWVLLLIGIITIALVPVLFAQSERKKHSHE